MSPSIGGDMAENFPLMILISGPLRAPLIGAGLLYLTPLTGSALRAPPINGVRADCDSHPRKGKTNFLSWVCDSRGSTARLRYAPHVGGAF